MGLFDFFKTDTKTTQDVLTIQWAKTKTGKFRRLPFLDLNRERLDNLSGVYVVWHGGTKPGWVYVGMTDDLHMDLLDIKENKDVIAYDVRGGLFVTWQVFPKSQRAGIFAFLSKVLQPEIRNPEAETVKADPIKVLPPGYTKETFASLF